LGEYKEGILRGCREKKTPDPPYFPIRGGGAPEFFPNGPCGGHVLGKYISFLNLTRYNNNNNNNKLICIAPVC